MSRAAFCLSVLALTLGSRAEAQQVLNFNEVVLNGQAPALSQVTCAGATGFRFRSDHFHLTGGSYVDFTSNGTNVIGYEGVRGFPIVMERVGGGTFALLSLDAAEFYAAPSVSFPNADFLTVTGTLQGGGTVTHTVALDGVYDGPGGAVDFQPVTLPNSFVNLVSVVFSGSLSAGGDGGVSVDNLTYQLAVPETLAPCVQTPVGSTNPVVNITNPTAGNVSATITVSATATDNTGIVGVQFKLDGVNLGAADASAPYSVQWDTTTVADGPHTISADATDTDGNVSTASVVVTVRNDTSPNQNPHYLDLDGVDDYLRASDTNAVSFGNGTVDSPFTLEVWIRPDGMSQGQQLVSKWGEVASQGQEYKLHIASNAIRLDLRDHSANAMASVFTNNQAALAGNWHHVAVTYDGRGGSAAANGLTIYIDGAAVAVNRMTSPAYVAMENGTAPLQIGREGPGFKLFNGGLDELRLWNGVRTAGAIQATMTTELDGTEAGLVGYWRFNEGSGTSAGDDVNGNIATLFNGPVWTAGGPMASGPPDTTPPQISNILGSSLTSSGVTITFTTNESTTARVAYTAGAACPCTEVPSPTTGTSHSVTLSGLAPATQYLFEVRATDGANNTTVSSPMMSFQTLAAPTDVTPPTVSMVQPPAGPVSGTIQVEASATDNVGVASVQFKIDGVNLGAADTTAPYQINWNTATAANGPHTITAEARDAANNVSSAQVSVTVSNGSGSPFYLDLDGTDDYMRVADADALSFGTGSVDTPLTLEAWIRPDGLSVNQYIASKWGEVASQGQEYKLHIASNTIRLDLRDHSANALASAFTGNQAVLAGAWHHVAVTYDGRGGAAAANGITIYIDGVAVAVTRLTHAAYVAMENGTAPLQLGREGPGAKHYNGGLDELRVWGAARSASAIVGSMNAALTGSEPGLVGYWRFDAGAGTTAADSTAAGRTMTLFNGPVWTAGGPMASGPPDTTPPQISNILGSSLTSSGVTITFTTNESTTARVAYTAGAACPCTEVPSPTTGTSHSVTLSGLAPATQYLFEVRATDGANNTTVSSPMMSFQTLAAPTDVTPPTVSMVQPPAGPVSGTIQVEASATDNVGVASVQFKIDGVNLGAADTTAPYQINWNTATAANGPHTITAEARDAANNVSSAQVSVTVSNGSSSPFYLDLDGTDDYMRVADADALSFGTGSVDTPLTLEAWIRPDGLSVNQYIASKWGEVASQGQEYKLHITSNTIRLDLRDHSANALASAFTGNQAALAGAWHHVAVTYDGRGGAAAANGITIYIDGVAVAVTRLTHAAYVAMENGTAPLQLGREGPGAKHYNGGLDELRVWGAARSASAIVGSMNAALTGSEPGLVGYWRFDAGAGTTAADSTAAGRTMTLFNGPVWTAGGPPVP